MVVHIAAPEGKLGVRGRSLPYAEGVFLGGDVNRGGAGVLVAHLTLGMNPHGR